MNHERDSAYLPQRAGTPDPDPLNYAAFDPTPTPTPPPGDHTPTHAPSPGPLTPAHSAPTATLEFTNTNQSRVRIRLSPRADTGSILSQPSL